MAVWSNVTGTLESLFRIGVGGLGLRSQSGRLQVRNASDSGLGDLEVNRLSVALPGNNRQTFSDTDAVINPSTTLMAHVGDSLTGLRTVTLPTGVSTGYSVMVVDETGLASWWHPLRIVPAVGTINKRSHIDIQFPFQGAWITFDGSNWFATISQPAVPFIQQNQLFSRHSGIMGNGVVVGGRGLDLFVDSSGAGFQISARHATSHLGGVMFSAGTSNSSSAPSDRAYITGGNNLIFPSGTIRFLCGIRSMRLNDGTDNLSYSFGFRDGVASSSGTAPTDAIYWSYGDTGNPSTTNWTAITANDNNRTRIDTGIAVTPGETWLGIEISPTDAKFFVNNTLAATITTNIPRTVGRDCAIRAGFNRMAGTNAIADCLLVSEIRYAVLP